MEINEQLIEQIAKIVLEQINGKPEPAAASTCTCGGQPGKCNGSCAGKKSPAVKTSYEGYAPAKKGTDPKEVVVGVGPAFQKEIRNTINGLNLDDVIGNIKAGIEEEGMVPRVVKVLKTSDVCFMGLEAAKISGSGIGIGLQSKGTAVIHQKDLYPLSNLELFPQAPLMTLETYRAIGKNAAKYVKGEKVSPIEGQNDPMVRAKYQVKAALMHIKETEQVDVSRPIIEWTEA
ncbi:propanediol/glycerol family dehydratase medium subunit [Anaerobium acetethylicum]|uniref:Propanediol dehydratase medium subunit n=1 Tax=Anaerobium acetethylicum TaxID=1619234 RepID=A0A1D3TRW4_9FIRM|nr:propanediol/glycerol family dehydratase medium subunit [Anaerobium acetethylicum]SCP96526.1 propanediol dehydratase medium subunit [Anaerobium acetethylicum]